MLEDAICQNSCLKLVLRLVCLTSLCSNGLYSTDYERLKKMFLQTYGFEHIVTFSLLLRTGLINIKVPLLILYYLLNVYILNRIVYLTVFSPFTRTLPRVWFSAQPREKLLVVRQSMHQTPARPGRYLLHDQGQISTMLSGSFLSSRHQVLTKAFLCVFKKLNSCFRLNNSRPVLG